jgi:hypothetical protein
MGPSSPVDTVPGEEKAMPYAPCLELIDINRIG